MEVYSDLGGSVKKSPKYIHILCNIQTGPSVISWLLKKQEIIKTLTDVERSMFSLPLAPETLAKVSKFVTTLAIRGLFRLLSRQGKKQEKTAARPYIFEMPLNC